MLAGTAFMERGKKRQYWEKKGRQLNDQGKKLLVSDIL